MFVIAILAGIAARLNDKRDWERVSRVQTESSSSRGLETELLLQNTSTALEEPLTLVRARRSELLSYTSLWQ